METFRGYNMLEPIKECMFHERTWQEIKDLSGSPYSVIVLPLGTVEQHGPHLPLGTDTFILEGLLKESCKKSMQKGYILILPTLPYGFSHHHTHFPGTVSIDSALLGEIVYSIGRAILTMGFRKLLLISWHGGHSAVMHDASYRLKVEFEQAVVVYASIIEMIFDKIKDLVIGPIYHADDLETSLMLALNQRVLTQKVTRDGETSYIGDYVSLDFRRKSRVRIPVRVEKFSKTGTIGDPTQASKERGTKMLEAITDELSRLLDALSYLPLT